MSRHWFRLIAVAGVWSLVGLFAACDMPGNTMTGPYPPPTARPMPPPTTPGQGWQRGVMAYRVAMGLRQRRRVPVFLFFYRPT